MRGRSSRAEFWWFILLITVVHIGLVLALNGRDWFHEARGGSLDTLGGPVPTAWVLLTLVPSITAGVRRMHDIDKSGWWLLLWLIPLVGWFIVLPAFVVPGTKGRNRFGPDPLGPPEVGARVFA